MECWSRVGLSGRGWRWGGGTVGELPGVGVGLIAGVPGALVLV